MSRYIEFGKKKTKFNLYVVLPMRSCTYIRQAYTVKAKAFELYEVHFSSFSHADLCSCNGASDVTRFISGFVSLRLSSVVSLYILYIYECTTSSVRLTNRRLIASGSQAAPESGGLPFCKSRTARRPGIGVCFGAYALYIPVSYRCTDRMTVWKCDNCANPSYLLSFVSDQFTFDIG